MLVSGAVVLGEGLVNNNRLKEPESALRNRTVAIACSILFVGILALVGLHLSMNYNNLAIYQLKLRVISMAFVGVIAVSSIALALFFNRKLNTFEKQASESKQRLFKLKKDYECASKLAIGTILVTLTLLSLIFVASYSIKPFPVTYYVMLGTSLGIFGAGSMLFTDGLAQLVRASQKSKVETSA